MNNLILVESLEYHVTAKSQWPVVVRLWARGILYFTTKRLHEQYTISSGHNRWILCPLVPEGIIQFGFMPAGVTFRFSHELLHQFS